MTREQLQCLFLPFLVLLYLVQPGRANESEAESSDANASEDLYDDQKVIVVKITMTSEDWSFVRTQQRDVGAHIGVHCLDKPPPSPFEYREASVEVDGQVRDRVGVRKKGFAGSLDTGKPSLKIKVDKYNKDNELLFGKERITLNNNKQDPSHIHQCLTYGLFRGAGLPASRCSFAHVYVNGEDLGIYTNVEAVKKRFLTWNGLNKSGLLYEGALSDFHDDMINSFTAKTDHTEKAGMTLLKKAAEALKSPDDALELALGKVFKLDMFFTFWAMEVLCYHGDGYSPFGNNFIVYADPDEQRFQFIPWGTDNTFTYVHVPAMFEMITTPRKSVMAGSLLTYRLYSHPTLQKKYVDRLNELLNPSTLWNETYLLSEARRMAELVTPHVRAVSMNKFKRGVSEVEKFIEGRRSSIENEMSNGPVALGHGHTNVAEAFCRGGISREGTDCDENCMYEGCHQRGWALPSYCHEGMCLHGYDADECIGKENGHPLGSAGHKLGENSWCFDGRRDSACAPANGKPASGKAPDGCADDEQPLLEDHGLEISCQEWVAFMEGHCDSEQIQKLEVCDTGCKESFKENPSYVKKKCPVTCKSCPVASAAVTSGFRYSASCTFAGIFLVTKLSTWVVKQ